MNESTNSPAPAELLDAQQVAEISGLKISTVYQYHRFDRMPKAATTFGRSPVWDKSEIIRWLDDKNNRNHHSVKIANIPTEKE